MLKLLACFAIIAVCSYGGFFYSKKYRRREKFYFDALNFCNAYKANLGFLKLSLNELCAAFKADNSGDFADFLCNALNGEITAECEVKDNLSCLTFLSAEQVNFINRFVAILGRGDASSQSLQAEGYKQQIETYLKQAKEERAKKGVLCAKLGIVTGVFLSILII